MIGGVIGALLGYVGSMLASHYGGPSAQWGFLGGMVVGAVICALGFITSAARRTL